MADPIVQFGGPEGEQLAKWQAAEEKRIAVLQRAATRKLERQLEIQKRRIEIENRPERVAHRNPWIKDSDGPKDGKLSRDQLAAAKQKEEDERWRKYEEETERAAELEEKERRHQEKVEEARRQMMEKAKKLSLENQRVIERARQRVIDSQADLESSRTKMEESLAAAEERKGELEKERAARDKERYAAMKEKYHQCLQRVQQLQKDKTEKLKRDYEASHKRFDKQRAVVEAEKTEAIKNKMNRQEELRKKAEKELAAKLERDEEERLAKWRKFTERHERANQRLAARKEYEMTKFSQAPKEDWKHYLADNVKHGQQQEDMQMHYHAEKFKRALAIAEEFDRRKDMVRKAAREMHYEQAKIRSQIKAACYSNESALILQGPVSEKARMPDVKMPKPATFKPIQHSNFPKPEKPPVDKPPKYMPRTTR